MKPGRELDALVAERVMGWTDIKFGEEKTAGLLEGFGQPPSNSGRIAFPNYSTDISAAWEILEEFCLTHLTHGVNGWCCIIGRQIDETTVHSTEAKAETAPHAICLAALKVLGLNLGTKNILGAK